MADPEFDDHVVGNQVLYDKDGNAVSVVLDGTTYRLAVDANVTQETGDVVVVVPPGGNVAVDKIIRSFLLDGANENMVVDGSSTPVVFTFDADPSDDIKIYEVRFVVSTDDISWNDDFFFEKEELSTGCVFEVRSGGTTTTLATLTKSEDFLNFPSVGGGIVLIQPAGVHDVLVVSWPLPSIQLDSGSSDFVKMTINDTIDDDHVKYTFTATVHGFKV